MFESPVVSIHIPPVLRRYVAGHEEVTVSGDTVGDLFDSLGHEYPAIRQYLVAADGGLQPSLNVYLGSSFLQNLQGLETPVGLEEVMSIISNAEN